MGDGEKLLTHLNSALKVLLGLDIFPRVPKKKLNFVVQCNLLVIERYAAEFITKAASYVGATVFFDRCSVRHACREDICALRHCRPVAGLPFPDHVLRQSACPGRQKIRGKAGIQLTATGSLPRQST